eukprot:CAMPEP_0183345626 /NCGR_PEP_ID=MMETSP0164_2-20130417/11000_1 /TAXON_ID=221442 /ORGANISM="Coccolithus pelagicus ssp braarudi, Strain PLY182g" /LENGTH=169 /DNA_ID=CAMNT_0025516789 /DNA_START=284 /DNA_END=790 /DNA_ORIENTATION=+
MGMIRFAPALMGDLLGAHLAFRSSTRAATATPSPARRVLHSSGVILPAGIFVLTSFTPSRKAPKDRDCRKALHHPLEWHGAATGDRLAIPQSLSRGRLMQGYEEETAHRPTSPARSLARPYQSKACVHMRTVQHAPLQPVAGSRVPRPISLRVAAALACTSSPPCERVP